MNTTERESNNSSDLANSEANLHQLTLPGLPGNGLDYS